MSGYDFIRWAKSQGAEHRTSMTGVPFLSTLKPDGYLKLAQVADLGVHELDEDRADSICDLLSLKLSECEIWLALNPAEAELEPAE